MDEEVKISKNNIPILDAVLHKTRKLYLLQWIFGEIPLHLGTKSESIA